MLSKNTVMFFGLLCMLDSVFVYAPPKARNAATMKNLSEDQLEAILMANTSSPEYQAAAAKKAKAKIAKIPEQARVAQPPKSLTVTEHEGSDIFMDYVEDDDFERVKLIIFDAPELIKKIINKRYGFSETTALMAAAQNNNVAMVELLLRMGAAPNLQSKEGHTALMMATEKNNVMIVELLLRNHANPDLQDKEGNHALLKAASNNNSAIVALLLAQNANPNLHTKDGDTPLFFAAYNNNAAMVKRLLDVYAEPNFQRDDGMTALMAAVFRDNLEIVKRLLDANAGPDLQRKDRATALIIAAQNGKLKMVDMLLKAKAKPNVPGENGVTALMQAVIHNHPEVVIKLLAEGADPNLQTKKEGMTSLMLALAQQGTPEKRRILEMLLMQSTIDFSLRDLNGRGLYDYACLYQEPWRTELLRLLKKYRPTIEEEDALFKENKRFLEAILKESKRLEEEEQLRLENELKLQEEQNRLEQEELLEFEKQELLKEQEELRKERDAKAKLALEQKHAARQLARKRLSEEKARLEQNRLKALNDARLAAQAQKKRDLQRKVAVLVSRVALQEKYCTEMQAREIRSIVDREAITIPREIATRCANPVKLFDEYEAAINIDHIINTRVQFSKVPHEDHYTIIFTGGHFVQSIENLITYGFVISQKKEVLPGEAIRYTLVNKFDGSVFVKTAFPEKFTINNVVDAIVASARDHTIPGKDFFGNESYVVSAHYGAILTKNILRNDFFTKKMSLMTSYPVGGLEADSPAAPSRGA